MFRDRPGFARMTAVAVAAASCLTAAACGSTASSLTATSTASATPSAGASSSSSAAPSAGGTQDPLAGQTATQLVKTAVANLKAASSVTMAGTLNQSGTSYDFNLGLKPGQGCAGTIVDGSKGSFKIILLGTTVYFNPDSTFWKSSAGADASAVIALVNGRYIKTSTSNSDMASLASLCNVSRAVGPTAVTGTFTKGTPTTLGGIRVLPLKNLNGSTFYVTDSSTPQIVKLIQPKDTGNGTGTFTFSVGAPVTLTAPPASQVLNGSAIGL